MSPKHCYGDRFIPSRAGANWDIDFNAIQVTIGSSENSTNNVTVVTKLLLLLP